MRQATNKINQAKSMLDLADWAIQIEAEEKEEGEELVALYCRAIESAMCPRIGN